MKKQDFFKQFVTYLEHKQSYISPKTYLTYKVTYTHLQSYFYTSDTVTDQSIRSYIENRIKQSVSGARKDVINLNAFFKECKIKWHLNKPRLPQSTPKFLSKIEVATLKISTYTKNPELSKMVIFALATGMRLGEILNLKMSDLDFENETITISNSAEFHTKTGKYRVIPMSDRVLELLLPFHNNEYVFRFPFANKERYVQKNLKKYLKQIGMRPEISWHMFRHTHASMLVRKNVSIFTVSELLGHESVKTTMIYAKLDMSTKREAVNLL